MKKLVWFFGETKYSAAGAGPFRYEVVGQDTGLQEGELPNIKQRKGYIQWFYSIHIGPKRIWSTFCDSLDDGKARCQEVHDGVLLAAEALNS